jgi:cytidine diphosphoramidate kinase
METRLEILKMVPKTSEGILIRETIHRAMEIRALKKKIGGVIWITGLSGVGKSTIARDVVQQLKRKGISVLLLDGDQVRATIGDPHVGYDRESRLVNALRICRLAKLVSEQGVITVAATISLFREVHEWNRNNLPCYFEVYITAAPETLKRRNPHGVNRRRERGEVCDVVGIDLHFDKPKTPDLVIENEGPRNSCSKWAEKILQEYRRKNEDYLGLHQSS